ncbi:hypothetical protein, partial [Mesorhizobium sp. M0323]|uniref:hypothetical protein n=1 Tax=Mesorhizobium sp. M0323 TaxID=2956938 RepID=UPI0033355844
NPIEPPWYVIRMPGGVGGAASRGVALSRSITLRSTKESQNRIAGKQPANTANPAIPKPSSALIRMSVQWLADSSRPTICRIRSAFIAFIKSLIFLAARVLRLLVLHDGAERSDWWWLPIVHGRRSSMSFRGDRNALARGRCQPTIV